MSRYRVEQTSTAVQWTGSWSLINNPLTSGGSANVSQTAGSTATFTFTGTDVCWIGYRDAWSGVANVYIDGALKATVDTYAAKVTTRAKAVLYSATGLTSGTHTIVIEATGTKRSAAKGAWVWVDAFDYFSSN